MRNLILATVFACGVPGFFVAAEMDQNTEATAHSYKEVSTTELKSWYDQKKPMVVIDARKKENFDNTMLPEAKWLPFDTTDMNVVAATIPSKDSVVVIYSCDGGCYASEHLGDELVKMGYTNVYDYRAGLKEWKDLKYPTVQK